MKETTKENLITAGAVGLGLLGIYGLASQESKMQARAEATLASHQSAHEQVVDTNAPHGDITKGEAIQIFDARDGQVKEFCVPK